MWLMPRRRHKSDRSNRGVSKGVGGPIGGTTGTEGNRCGLDSELGGAFDGATSSGAAFIVDEERLKLLLDEMAQDPLTLQETILTYQGLAEHLEEIGGFTMPEADRSLANQDEPGAERAMDQAIAELEKMNQLSAQAARAQIRVNCSGIRGSCRTWRRIWPAPWGENPP